MPVVKGVFQIPDVPCPLSASGHEDLVDAMESQIGFCVGLVPCT